MITICQLSSKPCHQSRCLQYDRKLDTCNVVQNKSVDLEAMDTGDLFALLPFDPHRINSELMRRARVTAIEQGHDPDELFADDGPEETVLESWERHGTWSGLCPHGAELAEPCARCYPNQ